jgi:hypothetical protein
METLIGISLQLVTSYSKIVNRSKHMRVQIKRMEEKKTEFQYTVCSKNLSTYTCIDLVM